MNDKNSELKDKLFAKKQNGWEGISDEEKKIIFNFSKEYINFLNIAKTEREVILYSKDLAEKSGFKNIQSVNELHAGDKVYYINRDKNIYLAVIGEEDMKNGLHLVGAHVDSPRLDLKPNPLYESEGFALLRTHYYGGIKKYQWVTMPLAIHGVIVKTNGEKVNVVIGENEEEPIFTITDLLPHLAEEQMSKKIKDAIEGENLNLLVGNIPFDDSKSGDKVKLNIMNILNEKYGIVEKDFLSAELELVPGFKARSLGFDESMVAGYGQDDRACGYTSLRAILDTERPKKTAICILADKEEIGSVGNTGMQTKMFDVFVSELLDKTKQNSINAIDVVYSKSKMLSADVNAALDPLYSNSYEKSNAAYIGEGIGLNKYTGQRGKMGGSDANAEFVAEVRSILEQNNIQYNISELGKVDVGGGGTIAYILANKGMDVVDCGVAVLSMHSPYEVTSKFDIYTAYRAYKAFYDYNI
ncbi:MAG: aminopeptidase [Oscillospiraceae bacterium]|nr:aminopeptidase [Oscillospiraceae bacterium]